MNDNAKPARVINEDQVDRLLKNFFQLEVPAALEQPFQPSTVTLSVASDDAMAQPRRGRRVTVAVAVLAMVFTVVLALNSTRPPGSSGIAIKPPEVPATEQTMPVSSDGTRQQQSVSEDGVTLEEMDNVDLAPSKKAN